MVGSFPDHRRWTVFHLPSTPGVTGAVGWATSGGIRADDGELMRPELKQGARAGRHPTRPGQGPGGRPAALRAVRDDDGPGCCLPPLGIETPRRTVLLPRHRPAVLEPLKLPHGRRGGDASARCSQPSAIGGVVEIS